MSTNGQRVQAGDLLATLDDARSALQEGTGRRRARRRAHVRWSRPPPTRSRAETAHATAGRRRRRSTARASARGGARTRSSARARAVELAANSLDYATLRADADGVVTRTSLEPGQVVAAGQPVLQIARSGELEAVVALAGSFRGALPGRREARLPLWGRPDKSYRRSCASSAFRRSRDPDFRGPLFDRRRRRRHLARHERDPRRLRAGRLRKVGERPALGALSTRARGRRLEGRRDEGQLTLAPVEVLRYEAETALVSGGVAEGDTIVILGVHKLDAGQKVRPVAARLAVRSRR